MEILQTAHSYLAYIVLAVLFIAVANAILGLAQNKMFTLEKDFRISLFALIVSLLLSFIDVQLSTRALSIQLSDMRGDELAK